MKNHAVVFASLCLLLFPASAQEPPKLTLPNSKTSFHFAVIGDTGTGGKEQYQVGAMLTQFQKTFSFDVVLMTGDNLYGGESPKDFANKFEKPYADLLKAGVKFYASLGNHDNSNQRFYENFNMKGERYYTYKPRDGVRFIAIDSNYPDKPQLDWMEKQLAASGAEWKIVFFHHPLYSSGKTHGPNIELRKVLEPIFVKHGVSLVLSGHEHFYERLKPQNGIAYFILGSSAKLRKGDMRKTDASALSFDADNAFMLFEIDGDTLHFQTISRTGATIDSGTILRAKGPANGAPTQ